MPKSKPRLLTLEEVGTLFRILAGILAEHAREDLEQAVKDREGQKYWRVSASAWDAAAHKTLEVADVVERLDSP